MALMEAEMTKSTAPDSRKAGQRVAESSDHDPLSTTRTTDGHHKSVQSAFSQRKAWLLPRGAATSDQNALHGREANLVQRALFQRL